MSTAIKVLAIGVALAANGYLDAQTASGADAKFVEQAAQGGIAEVEYSQLAATHSSNPAVQKFAAQMVSAHEDNNAKLRQIAQSEGLSIPSETDQDHVTLRHKLEQSNGPDFDRVYVQAMRRDHRNMLDLLNGATVQDAQLKAFIADTKPAVEHHLKMADEITGP